MIRIYVHSFFTTSNSLQKTSQGDNTIRLFKCNFFEILTVYISLDVTSNYFNILTIHFVFPFLWRQPLRWRNKLVALRFTEKVFRVSKPLAVTVINFWSSFCSEQITQSSSVIEWVWLSDCSSGVVPKKRQNDTYRSKSPHTSACACMLIFSILEKIQIVITVCI